MRLPLIFGCAALSGLLLSAQVFAQDSIPLFGDKTPDIVNPVSYTHLTLPTKLEV